MATAVKNRRSVYQDGSLYAGTSGNSGALDLRTAVGDALVLATVTNLATGPTLPCRVRVQVSGNGTDWVDLFEAFAGTANNGVYVFRCLVPAPALYARVVFDSHTDSAVSVTCEIHEYTSLG